MNMLFAGMRMSAADQALRFKEISEIGYRY